MNLYRRGKYIDFSLYIYLHLLMVMNDILISCLFSHLSMQVHVNEAGAVGLKVMDTKSTNGTKINDERHCLRKRRY